MPLEYLYLLATLPVLIIWLIFFLLRRDLRKEMIELSILIGVLSVLTSYYWWTVDWWHPPTMTGTRVGIEDFLLGFGMGGIMAVIYEVVVARRYSKRRASSQGMYGFFVILFLLAQTTQWLFYGVGITSFYATTTAMILVSAVMLCIRKDLIVDAMVSGFLSAIVSMVFYATIILVSPEWIENTYIFNTLSGIRVVGVPVEEFIFWFLAGMVFGPFYEFWKGLRLKKVA